MCLKHLRIDVISITVNFLWRVKQTIYVNLIDLYSFNCRTIFSVGELQLEISPHFLTKIFSENWVTEYVINNR